MAETLPATFDAIVEADDDLKDRVAALRDSGFEPVELVLMSLVIDPTFEGRRGPSAYRDRLAELGIHVTTGKITSILKKKEFIEHSNRLLSDLIVDVGMWDVYKNMIHKASDPKDQHAVQAARLLFQATGKLKTNNEPIDTPETDAFARMVLQVKPGKVSYSERRIELEVADATTVQGPKALGQGTADAGDTPDAGASGDHLVIDNPPTDDSDE